MHKPQGCVVISTYCTFRVYCFQVLYSIEHVIIRGFYIGIINLWVSVVGHIYMTLEMFSLVPFSHVDLF
jgi:hypothetical protein